MPADDSSLGISNTWYKPGFSHLQQIDLPEGIAINILPAPYFLATKIEAFRDRGNNDFFGSHDFEDIIYLLDNRMSIVEEIAAAENELKAFIQQELNDIMNHPHADEILSMHIHPLVQQDRFPILMEKIKAIIT